MLMLDKDSIQQILNDILESPEFKESHRYSDLLRYLVEESLAERTPKEITIGMRFFGKDASFNSKEDASVRVYLNNLRKKLEHYYFTSEKPHSHKLNIPVGHYKVEFIPITEKTTPLPRKTPFRTYSFIALSIFAAFGLGYFVNITVQPKQHAVEPPNPLWNDFVNPYGRPTLIVLGDYFFLRERNTISTYYRTITINSPDDYRQRVLQDPSFAKRYEQNEFTFLRPSAPWGIVQILPILQNSKNEFSLKLASQFTVADFKSNNIIFIGSLKTLFGFQKFLHIFNIDYTVNPSSIRITGGQKDSLSEFSLFNQRGGTYEKDYAIVAKGAGPDGSTILMLLGLAESGAIEATHAACDPLLLKTIETKYSIPSLKDPYNFTLVIGTEGMTQAIFNSNIRCFVINKPLQNISDAAPKDPSALIQ
jgi:hypothetical protein